MKTDSVNLRDAFLDKHKNYFSGIGKETVNRIFACFSPTELLSHIKNKNRDVLRRAGLSNRQVMTLYAGYAAFRPLLEVAVYLDNNGFSRPMAVKVFRVWGHNCLEKIQKNPYRLLALALWEEVDKLGLKRGREFHPCRLVAAILNCMYIDYEEDKNTYISASDLFHKVNALIGCSRKQFDEGLELAILTNSVIQYNGQLQVPAVHVMERRIEQYLGENSKTGLSETIVNGFLDNCTFRVLTNEQKSAVRNGLIYSKSAISGRGGRGKTFILSVFADGVETLLKKKIIPVAVSAKAKLKIEREVGRPGFTVAYLLHVTDKEYLSNSVIAIDEASMLSLIDFYQLIRKLPASANIVFVGDHYQIPSIDAGRLFFDIIDKNVIPHVELTINKRQDDKTDNLLNQVLNGYFPLLQNYYPDAGPGLYKIQVKNIEEAEKQAAELYTQLSCRGENVQCISPLNKHSGGSKSINPRIHMLKFNRADFCEGTPVVWTDIKKVLSGTKLTNGSFGHVKGQAELGYYLNVSFDGFEESVQLTWEEVSNYLEFSYCLTVHRAQGSEWQTVIIVLPKSHRMIDRNMVYTSLSRCKSRAIVIYEDHCYVSKKVAGMLAHEKRRSMLFERCHEN
jgi:exodeoxyribonuclease V alpha subunit